MTAEANSALAAATAIALILPCISSAATMTQKQLASSLIEKNARTIADVGDSIYYFAECGLI